jgi:hypothetical protein
VSVRRALAVPLFAIVMLVAGPVAGESPNRQASLRPGDRIERVGVG